MAPLLSQPSLRKAGIVLLSLCLIAGVIYSFALPAQARFFDEQEYLHLGGHLLHGPGYSMDGVHLTASRLNLYNHFAPENKGEVTVWRQVILAITYGTLLALLVWRLLETKRFPLTTHEKLFLIIYVLSAFTSAIFFTRIRLRLPYDYLVIAIIAMHLSRRLQLWLEHARSVSAPNLAS